MELTDLMTNVDSLNAVLLVIAQTAGESPDTIQNLDSRSAFEGFVYSLPGMLINISIVIAFVLFVVAVMSKQRKLRKLGATVGMDANGKLISIDFEDKPLTDAGLRNLRGLANVQKIWLNGTKITDAGLVHLTGLSTLKELGLFETDVTDAGLEQLHGLSNLEDLIVERTKVTDAGVEKLKAALPSCHVRR
ncbi:MAG TPA: hypothetical protein EYG03_13705 [Planctomycetes bacterium]|nr:hypothetical protein [Fuerstiella sp.]HIK93016.1 hypothetical protein [Planctomycetota bacterium]